MVRVSCFTKDPEPPLILIKSLVFAVAAGCVASDVVFFLRTTPENYGLLIWRIPLEAAVCLTYLVSLVHQGWHRLRHKYQTIGGKRRLLWLTPVVIALAIVVVADMIREMNRVQRWRDTNLSTKSAPMSPSVSPSPSIPPTEQQQQQQSGVNSSSSSLNHTNSSSPAVTTAMLLEQQSAVTQFWTCSLTNAFYESSSTATKMQHGPDTDVGGWNGYCVARNFGWCGGLVLALVFAADVAYTYAKRHQLQAKNEMAMKRELEGEVEAAAAAAAGGGGGGGRGGVIATTTTAGGDVTTRKSCEVHALGSVPSMHSRTTDNLIV
ncbi:hypothetical protein BGZ73_001101 [Actinomortierella ambigua]|nr:hypothetical protein BGZ73_001101 [Actinomortierella ambigua]